MSTLYELRRAPWQQNPRPAGASKRGDSGQAVGYGTHVYRASRYSLELSLVAR
jgi:hypothetical protein